MRAICVAVRSASKTGCVPAYTSETGRISTILPERRQLPNSTKTLFPTLGSAKRSLGMYQSTKTSVGWRISAIGVPATSDWPTRARFVETIPAIGATTRLRRNCAPRPRDGREAVCQIRPGRPVEWWPRRLPLPARQQLCGPRRARGRFRRGRSGWQRMMASMRSTASWVRFRYARDASSDSCATRSFMRRSARRLAISASARI